MIRQRDDKDLEAHVPMAELSECDLEKATGGSPSSGSGSGKVQHGDFQFQKYLDKASIIL
jgi:type VI protein secretion system component Hcp